MKRVNKLFQAHFPKPLMIGGGVGASLLASSLVIMAAPPAPPSSCNVDATYPQRDATTCSITDNADLTALTDSNPDNDVVIFHYSVDSISNDFSVDTSTVCLNTSTDELYALEDAPEAADSTNSDSPDLVDCEAAGYEKHPSRVYFYVDGDITLGGGNEVGNTADGGFGKGGDFRIYGNPDPNPTNPADPAQDFSLNGNVCLKAFIYAPYAHMGINGGAGGCDGKFGLPAKTESDAVGVGGVYGAVWVKSWGNSNSDSAGVIVPTDLAGEFGDLVNEAGLNVYKTSAPQTWRRVEASN